MVWGASTSERRPVRGATRAGEHISSSLPLLGSGWNLSFLDGIGLIQASGSPVSLCEHWASGRHVNVES